MPGTNFASTFSSDIENYIADKVLPLARRRLCAYRFGDPLTLDKGRGVTYTATRFNRLPLPFQPISEGVPPTQGESLTLAQVSATCQQWGDLVKITDVAEMTIKHPLVDKANELMALQMSETLERNTFNALNALTQVNYVNSRGSRAALVANDNLDTATVNRTVALMVNLGAPRFLGDEQTDTDQDADQGGGKASNNPRAMPHYVAMAHPFIVADFSNASDVKTAWQYSDINRLYNFEVGEWRGLRFAESNMIPSWVGVAQINPTAVGSGGAFAATNYFVTVTASDTQNQYESRIYQVSTSTAVVLNGSMTVVLPSLPGFTFSVYVGTTSSPANLALCALGPTYGPLSGQATQLAGGQTVTITGIGVAQVPPAAPATGVTVFPTYVFGRGCYGQVKLDNAKFALLKDADKSDPMNQIRVLSWKLMYSTILLNVTFGTRIESTSANYAFG